MTDEHDDRDPDLDGTVGWGELLIETEQRLVLAQVPDPAVSARRIVEEASGMEGVALTLGADTRATVRGVAKLDAMVERRAAGEPLQYVVGRWGFRQLDLMVDRRVLIPRPETEVVAEHALIELRRIGECLDARSANTKAPVAVDLGTGSGALGLSLALEHPSAEVWLTDRSSDALDVARANLAGLGRHGARVRVVEGSWFQALPTELAGRIALIASNPPYVSPAEVLPVEVTEWEPADALVAELDGYAAYEVLINEAPRWLMAEGSLVLECAPHQVESLVAMAEAYFAEIETFADLAGRARGLVARLAS